MLKNVWGRFWKGGKVDQIKGGQESQKWVLNAEKKRKKGCKYLGEGRKGKIKKKKGKYVKDNKGTDEKEGEEKSGKYEGTSLG